MIGTRDLPAIAPSPQFRDLTGALAPASRATIGPRLADLETDPALLVALRCALEARSSAVIRHAAAEVTRRATRTGRSPSSRGSSRAA